MSLMTMNSARAFDRVFEALSRSAGFKSPLEWAGQVAREIEVDANAVVNDPVKGIYTVYEMVPKTYKVERHEDGSILHRLLTEDEVKALNDESDSK